MSGTPTPPHTPLRVAVLGNSNSIASGSYTQILSSDPAFVVTNRSIGGTVNVFLLDFLAMEDNLDYDFLILETGVIDFAEWRVENYPLPVLQRNLQTFIEQVRRRSRCKIVMLIVPHRRALLECGTYDIEHVYRSIAAANAIPVLNLYALFRMGFAGDPRAEIPVLCHYSRLILQALGLPLNLDESIAWRALRRVNTPVNALVHYGFRDTMHVSQPWHRVAAALLRDWMLNNRDPAPAPTETARSGVSACHGHAPRRCILRESSLISRQLAVLKDGETLIFDCAPDQQAVGLMVNRAQTSAYLTLSDGESSISVDCTFGPWPSDWVATIIPLTRPLNGRPITLSVTATEPQPPPILRMSGWGHARKGIAEVGELVLVSRDLLATPIPEAVNTTDDAPVSIERLPWSQQEFDAVCKEFHSIAVDLEKGFAEIPQPIAAVLQTRLDRPAHDDVAIEKARHFVLYDDLPAARQVLAAENASEAACAAVAAIDQFSATLAKLV